MNPAPVPPTDDRPRRTLSLAAALVALGAASLLAGCGEDSPAPSAPAPAPAPAPEPAPPPPPPEPETASYAFAQPMPRISPRVPGSMPEGVDFAPFVAVVAHARDAAPWTEGEMASDGLKMLAETGMSAGLVAEAEAAGMELIWGTFGEMIAFLLNPNHALELHMDRPCVSYAQQIAPSSDWFVGFSNICATDEDGAWQSELTGALVAYDAGTATGEDFMEKSADTEPREPIAELDVAPYFVAPAVTMELVATRKEE